MLCIMIICAGTVAAQQKGPAEAAVKGVIETVATGCEKEFAAYCQDVIPGDGRVLACLYAHADKLSGQCEYALFDAAAQLERAVAALAYLAHECGDDLENALRGCAGRRGPAAGLSEQERKESQPAVQAGVKRYGPEIATLHQRARCYTNVESGTRNAKLKSSRRHRATLGYAAEFRNPH